MEASDPFGTSGAATEPDPFEEIDGGVTPAEADEPTIPADEPPAEAPAEEPPIVDREGEPVAATPAAGPPATATAAGRAKLADEEAAPAAQDGAEAAPAAEETPAPPEEPQDAQGGSGGEPQEEAEAGTMRRYKLLYQTGPKQWAEAPLDQVPAGTKGVVVETDEKTGEHWLMARNADHARRLAWIIFNRPENGVMIVPVAGTSWKPKRVQRKVQPEREKLEIV